jgi:hypothetical protein
VTTGWFEGAVTSAAPAVLDELNRRLDDQLRNDDPTQRSLERMDWALQRRAQTPPAQRDERWHRAVDLVLDHRLKLMADRDRGYRLVDNRRLS